MTLPDSHEFFRQSAKNLLELAVSVCGARHGVIRVDGEPVISTDSGAPLPALDSFADDLLVEIDGAIVVALLDATGKRCGTLALLNDRTHSLTDLQKGTLLKTAAEVMRVLDRAAAIRNAHRVDAAPASLRVLIVEDDETVGRGLQWFLEREGMDVRVVTTGAAVMPAIAERGPDIIILDLSLPDEDGRRTYERIASEYSIPVIFSSGDATEGNIGDLVKKPRTRFLRKPYRTEELLDVIRNLTG